MQRFVLFGLFAAVMSVAACDGNTPTGAATSAPSTNISPELPVDDGGGGGGGDTGGDTGGGGGGYTPPPAPQYRIVGQVYKIESGPQAPLTRVKIRGWSRFEQLVGSSWVKIQADYLEVKCYAGGVYDDDDERPAGFTDVEFWTEYGQFGAGFTAQCTHKAEFRGVQYNTTSTEYMQFI
jgi:hypothetical protein